MLTKNKWKSLKLLFKVKNIAFGWFGTWENLQEKNRKEKNSFDYNKLWLYKLVCLELNRLCYSSGHLDTWENRNFDSLKLRLKRKFFI